MQRLALSLTQADADAIAEQVASPPQTKATNMNTLQAEVDHAWSDLETNYGPSVTDEDRATLRSLDDAAIDGTLTPEHLKRTLSTLYKNRRRQWAVFEGGKVDPAFERYKKTRNQELFGDYEAVIDMCLGGDPEVKLKVHQADMGSSGRRGLSTLKYHLRKAGAVIPERAAAILRSCEQDQDHPVDADAPSADAEHCADLRNIEQHWSKYRVVMMVEGKRHRRTFNTLEEAQRYRDRNKACFGGGTKAKRLKSSICK